MREIKIKLSNQTILLGATVFLAFALFYLLKNVVILFLLSFILASGIRPFVDKLEKYRVPRFLSVTIIYLLIFLFIGTIIALTVDVFLSQFQTLITSSPQLVEDFFRTLNTKLPVDFRIDSETVNNTVESLRSNVQNLEFRNISSVFEFLSTQIGSVGATGFKFVNSIVGIGFSIFIVFVGAGFMLTSKSRIYTGLLNLIPRDTSRANDLLHRIEKGIGVWFVGQLMLMFIVGILSYVFLMLPDIAGINGYEMGQIAVLLAIISGLNEAIPNIGPTVTTLIVVILGIAFGQSAPILVYLFVVFVVIQQLEAILIAPNIMKRVANLNPILTVFGLVAGFELGGVPGAILSLPVMTAIQISIEYISDEMKHKKHKQEKAERKKASEVSLKDKLHDFVSISRRKKN